MSHNIIRIARSSEHLDLDADAPRASGNDAGEVIETDCLDRTPAGKRGQPEDLRALADQISEEYVALALSVRSTMGRAIRIGELLIRVKATLKHGGFMTWVESNCPFSPRSAQGYMRLAKRGKIPNAQPVSLLPTIKNALRLLAEPRERRPGYRWCGGAEQKPEPIPADGQEVVDGATGPEPCDVEHDGRPQPSLEEDRSAAIASIVSGLESTLGADDPDIEELQKLLTVGPLPRSEAQQLADVLRRVAARAISWAERIEGGAQ